MGDPHHQIQNQNQNMDENPENPNIPNPNRPVSQSYTTALPPPPRSSEYRSPLYTRTPVFFQRGRERHHAGSSTYPQRLSPSYLSQPLSHSHQPQHNTTYGPSSLQIIPPSTSDFRSYHRSSKDNKRRRGRLATACVHCNRRKQKCDGDMPCGLCVKRNVTCSYPTEMNTSYTSEAERGRQAAAIAGPSSSRPLTLPADLPSHKKARMSKGESTIEPHDDTTISSFNKGKGRAGRNVADESAVYHERGASVPVHMTDNGHSGRSGTETRPRSSGMHHHSKLPLPLTSHPTSSERSTPFTSRQDQPQNQQGPESILGRFWRSHSDLRHNPGATYPSTDPASAKVVNESNIGGGSGSGAGSGRGSGDKDEMGSLSESDKLMEENEAHGVGSMRTHTGPWDDGKGEKTFFGTSHFGPQLAAKVIRSMPSVPLSDVRHAPYRGASKLDTVKPYTLESQTRDLISYLPAREECDRYVRRFYDRYNSHNDILYQPDFMISYHRFWNEYNIKQTSEVDLRYLSLLLIVLALGVLLDHDPSEKVFRQNQIIAMNLTQDQNLIIGDLIEGLENQTMSLKDRELKSSKWSWASKRALMESSNFFGESMDTVRAGLLIALYLNVCRRVPEAWTAIGIAIRAAQAQGLHVDGSSWKGMTTKEAELRRRLWAQLYIVDRSISLFLGRPVCIQDSQCTTLEPANMHDEELEMPSIFPRGLNIPTKTTFLILHYRLAKIIGTVQLKCFNLTPQKYSNIIECEELFINYKKDLPNHFKLDREPGTEFNLDNKKEYGWLPIQRQTLNSKFHLARISLHRPYLLRSLTTTTNTSKSRSKSRSDKGTNENPYLMSRDALLYSAMADLELRFTFNELDPLDRFKWMTVASGFNSATILGILCHLGYKDSRFPKGTLRSVLQDYISLEEKTIRRDETLETELMVLKMMEHKALAREESELYSGLDSSRNGSSGMITPTPSTLTAIPTGRGGSTISNDPRSLNVQVHHSSYVPPPLSSSMHSQPPPPSASTNSQSPVHPAHNHDISGGISAETSTMYWQSSSSSHTGHTVQNESNPLAGISDRANSVNQAQHQHNPSEFTLPIPSAPSLSTASISTALGYPNYNNQGQTQSESGTIQTAPLNPNHNPNPNQWYLPSDWDPTSSGLPDSSDPLAWQALLGMDWMNNLDLNTAISGSGSGSGGGESAREHGNDVES